MGLYRFIRESCPEAMNEWERMRDVHRLPKKDKGPVSLCDLLLRYALVLYARGETLELHLEDED